MASSKNISGDDDSLFSNESTGDRNTATYESIMASAGGVESLTLRLKLFREWIHRCTLPKTTPPNDN